MPRVINRKFHKDCPFTEKEVMGFYDMLYNVNAANHCMNPTKYHLHDGIPRLRKSKTL